MTSPPEHAPWTRWQALALIVAVLALLTAALGGWVGRPFFQSYLFAWIFWIGLSAGSLGILMMYHTTGGRWGTAALRPLEAAALTSPVMAVLMIPILIALPSLYPWAPGDAATLHPQWKFKLFYLGLPLFVTRTLFYVLLWSGLALYLRRCSLRQDADPQGTHIARAQFLSPPALVLLMLSAVFAVIDWIMSLEPDWSSTIFPVLVVFGWVILTFAFTNLAVIGLRSFPSYAHQIKADHLHDLGNLLLAFILFWTYMFWSQYLIVWSGNLPSETFWYMRRIENAWQWFPAIVVVTEFVAPFFALLFRPVKRSPRLLALVCAGVLVARIIETFWLVIPPLRPNCAIYWTDFALLISIGGFWVATFLWWLERAPLLPSPETHAIANASRPPHPAA